MLTKRILACLDVNGGRVVKGVQFENLRDAGDPAELAEAHSASGADEIVLLDISAAHERRATLLDTVRRAARQLFIPFTVGGGIRTLEDAAAVFSAGADKISINSAALADPDLITRIALRFGSQAVVVAIDAKRCKEPSRWEAYTHGGRTTSGRDAVEWANEAEDRGAGEILLTSMDRDGTGVGFDCELTRAVADAVRIPVIASGGAGGAQHFVEVFRDGHADAALAASIFHYGFSRLADLKQKIASQGIAVRWPC
jgi:imidazole glycerol-phosphate synthase subunit HisF